MCGRSSLTKTEKELEERFKSSFYSDDLIRYNPLPNYNVAPSHYHPVITNTEPDKFRFFRWGLIPFWAKDQKIGYKMINARVETLMQKPAFKTPLIKRRCLVPFDGFYEWKKEKDGSKTPYRIVLKQTEIFSLAGLWEKWTNEEGEDIYSFTVITQAPNKFMSKIHNRMPAILHPKEERLWLEEGVPVEDLVKLIKPYPDAMMDAYKVSTRVGNVRNNDASLIEPLPEIVDPDQNENTKGKDPNRHTLF